MKKPQLTNKKETMTNKLQNKIDELIKLEELHNIKEQYRQHEKTKSLYEQIDFKLLTLIEVVPMDHHLYEHQTLQKVR